MSKRVPKVSNGTVKLRERRIFSEALRRKIVHEVATKLHSISEIKRLYGVSGTAVYRWILRYTPGLVPGAVQVVQMESEAEKSRVLAERVAELERIIGRKQMYIDVLEKTIELASDSFGVDVKKSFFPLSSNGSASTGGSIPTK
jgi:transposase